MRVTNIGIKLSRRLYDYDSTKMDYFYDLFEMSRNQPFPVLHQKTGHLFICYQNGFYLPLQLGESVDLSEFYYHYIHEQKNAGAIIHVDNVYYVRFKPFNFFEFATEYKIVEDIELVPKASIYSKINEYIYILTVGEDFSAILYDSPSKFVLNNGYTTECVWIISLSQASLLEVFNLIDTEYERLSILNNMLSGPEPSVVFQLVTDTRVTVTLKLSHKKLASSKGKDLKMILPYKNPLSVRISVKNIVS